MKSNFIQVNPLLCWGTHRVWQAGNAWVVARGQGPSGQKASAFPFRISNCGFRILGFSFSIRIAQSTFLNFEARPIHEMEAAMVFAQKAIAPDPGTPPALPDCMILHPNKKTPGG